jgi:hypothetical protein
MKDRDAQQLANAEQQALLDVTPARAALVTSGCHDWQETAQDVIAQALVQLRSTGVYLEDHSPQPCKLLLMLVGVPGKCRVGELLEPGIQVDTKALGVS